MAAETKCTFGMRPPIDRIMLEAQIEREIKHYKIYNVYRPNFNVNPVTPKFYARHAAAKSEGPEEERRVAEYYKSVELARAKGPKNKFPLPYLESHNYGWYDEGLVNRKRMTDKRFFHPLVESEETKLFIIISKDNPKEKPTTA